MRACKSLLSLFIYLFIYFWVCVCIQSSLTLQPHGLWPSRFLCPWDFPGKNMGVVAMSSPRWSSQPQGWTHVSCISCIVRKPSFSSCYYLFLLLYSHSSPLAGNHNTFHIYSFVCNNSYKSTVFVLCIAHVFTLFFVL